jgi:hypothetical protein
VAVVDFLVAQARDGQLGLALVNPAVQDVILKGVPAFGSLTDEKSVGLIALLREPALTLCFQWKNFLAEALRVMDPLREQSPFHEEVFDVISLHLTQWCAGNHVASHQEKRLLVCFLPSLWMTCALTGFTRPVS